ncbi:hypothetical protein F2Q70_00028890 [Brassica cretica]|uniref:Uncharacterized protein n=1 Tax=Brassica cretica TaxID=69181 RepID=A0A8S9LBD5_BRACR|nr:hypothetical protein F2Q70_00028890 [Brassica cretica]
MDSKKFMQMVEEKKRQILEKKEAPLKWEQKLEAAAKAAGTKENKSKKRRHRDASESSSESDSSSEVRRKSRRTHSKHRRHAHSDSDDSNRRKDKKSRRHKRKSSSRSVDSSDEYESGSEDELRKTIKHHWSQVNNARSRELKDQSTNTSERKQACSPVSPQAMIGRGLRIPVSGSVTRETRLAQATHPNNSGAAGDSVGWANPVKRLRTDYAIESNVAESLHRCHHQSLNYVRSCYHHRLHHHLNPQAARSRIKREAASPLNGSDGFGFRSS